MLTNSILSNFVSSLKFPEFFPLNTQKNKIVAIALFSLSCIALLYLMCRCCCRIEPEGDDKEIKIAPEGEVVDGSVVPDENDSYGEPPPVPYFPIDEDDAFITPLTRPATPLKRTPKRETPRKATPLNENRKETRKTAAENKEAGNDDLKADDNEKGKVFNNSFGKVHDQMDTGRSLSSFTAEELKGMTPVESLFLNVKEFVKNRRHIAHVDPEQKSNDVEEDEWDYVCPNQSSGSQLLSIAPEKVDAEIYPQQPSLF